MGDAKVIETQPLSMALVEEHHTGMCCDEQVAAAPSSDVADSKEAARGAVVGEESSPGSELGSDLDSDEDFIVPHTSNLLVADIERVNRGKKEWKVQFGHGI